jgi:hypothetical protein
LAQTNFFLFPAFSPLGNRYEAVEKAKKIGIFEVADQEEANG